MLCGMSGSRPNPRRLPSIKQSTSAEWPLVMWTTMPPAKSTALIGSPGGSPSHLILTLLSHTHSGRAPFAPAIFCFSSDPRSLWIGLMPRRSRKKVGIIGLGIIGSRVAASLRKAGFAVYAWNRSPKIEPNFLGSPADLAATCEIIQLFVSDGSAVMQTLEAMAGQITPDHVVICSATIGPEATFEASGFVEERGAHFLDAPFTGSKGAAAKQELVYFVGGDDDSIRLAEPVLRASSKAVVKVGSIGQAAALKVATNMMVATAVQGLAEAFALVRAAGIDPKRLQDAIEHHATRSALIDMKLPKLLAEDWEPQFSLRHMLKDLDLAAGMAAESATPIPATTATSAWMRAAFDAGLADKDFSIMASLFGPAETPAPPEVEAEPSAQAAIGADEPEAVSPPPAFAKPAEADEAPAVAEECEEEPGQQEQPSTGSVPDEPAVKDPGAEPPPESAEKAPDETRPETPDGGSPAETGEPEVDADRREVVPLVPAPIETEPEQAATLSVPVVDKPVPSEPAPPPAPVEPPADEVPPQKPLTLSSPSPSPPIIPPIQKIRRFSPFWGGQGK
jgi:3-hydroxyisobutyrate dehydrogenase-like beta-hydroxyacid dehydrogenase